MIKRFQTLAFLIDNAAIHLERKAKEEFGPVGLSVPMARVLMVVERNPGIRVGQLSDAAWIEGPTLSHMLRRMAAKGLIAREREDGDQRAVKVKVTPRGHALASECLKFAGDLEEFLAQGIDRAKVDIFREVLAHTNLKLNEPGFPAIGVHVRMPQRFKKTRRKAAKKVSRRPRKTAKS